MATPQLYVGGLPIFDTSTHLDSLSRNIDFQTGANVERAMDGTLWIQEVVGWKKRVVTITGSGLPFAGFGDYLYQPATYIEGDLVIGGVITSVSGHGRSVWDAQDNWTIVLEES